MGKRKEKMISQGSRRRQILQLDDDSNNNNHPYPSQTWQGYGNANRDNSTEDVDTEEDKKVHNPLSGLLSHYMDSEDEADENQQEVKTSNGIKEESCSSENGKHNRIDMEVADFLKEIDALTTSEDMQTEEAESKDVSKKSSSNNGSDENSREASSSTDPTLVIESPVEAWQQCFDEMTGYTYFWNTVSNQVTWDCPEDYSQYLEETKKKSLHHSTASTSQLEDHKSSSEKHSSKKSYKSKSRKEPLSDEEGKIEPIRFYGPSSSNDESSSDEDDQKKPSKGQLMDTPSTSRDHLPSKEFGPSLLKEEEDKAHPINFTDDLSPTKIGPQLPPGFVLPGSDSPDLVNPRLTPELPIQTEPVASPTSCKMEVLPNFDLSPPHTEVLSKAEVDNAQENSGIDGDLNTLSQSKPDPEPNLAGSGNSSPTTQHQSPVVEFPLSQISCLEENEEPDSTTRVRSQKNETVNHSLPSNSEECIFVGQQNIPQVLPPMDDDDDDDEDSEEEHSCSAQPIISSSGASSFPPSFYEDDSNSDLPTRRGFGFKKQELPASNGGIETSKRKAQFQNSINFVKAETLDLTELNRKVASNWNSGTKERCMTPTDEGNDENDIDEIDRELDLALERKKNQTVLNGAGTSASLSSSSSTSSTSSSSSLAMSSLSSPFLSHLPVKRLKTENGEEPTEKKIDHPSISEEILSISSGLLERLNNLGITEESITTLHSFYIQIKTRLEDWRNGALEPNYLLACLHHMDGELRQQESGASIPGWVCQWDRYETFAFALYQQRLSLLFADRCHRVLQQHKEKSGSQTKNKNELLVWNCNLSLCLVPATFIIEFSVFGYDGGNKSNEKNKQKKVTLSLIKQSSWNILNCYPHV